MKLAEYEATQAAKKNKPLKVAALCKHCGKFRSERTISRGHGQYCMACAKLNEYIDRQCKKEAREQMGDTRDYRRKLAKEIIEAALSRIPRPPKQPLPLKVAVRGKPMSNAEEAEIIAAAKVTAQKALARIETKARLKRDEEKRRNEQAKALGYYRVGQ